MELLEPTNGTNGSTKWEGLTQAVTDVGSSPRINGFVTVEHRIVLDSILQKDFLDGTLMNGCDANSLVLHPVVLRFTYSEDDIIPDMLGLGIRKFVEQFAHAVCIEHGCVAQILLTLDRITDQSRIENRNDPLVDWEETSNLVPQASRGFWTICPQAMHEVERHFLIIQCFYHLSFVVCTYKDSHKKTDSHIFCWGFIT